MYKAVGNRACCSQRCDSSRSPKFSLCRQDLPYGDVPWSHFYEGLLYTIAHVMPHPVWTLLLYALCSLGWIYFWLDEVQLCFPEVPLSCPRLHTYLKFSPIWENVIEHKCELPVRQPFIKPAVLTEPRFIQLTKNMTELAIQWGIAYTWKRIIIWDNVGAL